GVVRISDETAVDDVRRTRNLGQRRGDQAAGAGFGGGDMQAAGAAKVQHAFRRVAQDRIDHVALHGNRTVAVAIATMPSPRPVKPSFSLVVALMATRLAAIPAIAAMRSRMASRCGETRGASQTTVTSRLAITPPRARTRSQAKARKRSEEAPFHCESLGGKCWPISPSANAP